jgi:hypothetical protein
VLGLPRRRARGTSVVTALAAAVVRSVVAGVGVENSREKRAVLRA